MSIIGSGFNNDKVSYSLLANRESDIYLTGLSSGKKVQLAVIPDGLSISKSASWSKQNTMGRSDPFIAYANSESTKITISTKFYARSSATFDVVIPIGKLRSFLVPGEKIPLPEIVLFVWGKYRVYVVVESVNITYKGPYSMPNLTPHQADVSIDMTQVFFDSSPTAENYVSSHSIF